MKYNEIVANRMKPKRFRAGTPEETTRHGAKAKEAR